MESNMTAPETQIPLQASDVFADAMPLSIQQLQAHADLIQQAMRSVMRPGIHYGLVPGCGNKPTLLKPGAEVLKTVFKLADDLTVIDLGSTGEAHYRIIARLIHIPSGRFVGSGLGECTSAESKYAWRKAVSQTEYDYYEDSRRRIKFSHRGELLQVRAEVADVSNTILKMAKKRALVDALLSIGASSLFSQDLEDMPPGGASTEDTVENTVCAPIGESGGIVDEHAQDPPPLCAKCNIPYRYIPGGTSKTTGKPYQSFWSCPNNRTCGARPINGSQHHDAIQMESPTNTVSDSTIDYMDDSLWIDAIAALDHGDIVRDKLRSQGLDNLTLVPPDQRHAFLASIVGEV